MALLLAAKASSDAPDARVHSRSMCGLCLTKGSSCVSPPFSESETLDLRGLELRKQDLSKQWPRAHAVAG